MKVADSASKNSVSYTASLSKREAALLAAWERARRSLVTLDDLRAVVGASAAKDVAWRLVRKKVLERVGRGRYLVRPLRAQGRPWAASAPVMATALMQGVPHYLGGLWALSFHRLTEQRYASVLDVFCAHPRPSRRLGHTTVSFHRARSAALARGALQAEVEDTPITVSTPERTVLDLLDLPGLAGGVVEGLRHLEAALPRLSVALLVARASEGSRASTCQRLGVLLERSGASARALQPLLRRTRETKSKLSLVPGRPRIGVVNRRWRVVENDR